MKLLFQRRNYNIAFLCALYGVLKSLFMNG